MYRFPFLCCALMTLAFVSACGEREQYPPAAMERTDEGLTADHVTASANWPQFRGWGARGVADGQNAPRRWDVEEGENVRWKTPIPGLGHSSPVVWEDKIFVTTAVGAEDELRIGLFGDVDSVEDDSIHQWYVYCLDKQTGQVLWRRLAHEGVPQVQRHSKSTHANPTPATDGKHVVALFGSEGLYCYDLDGHLLWQNDLGFLDSGWSHDPSFQWGFASSPIIYQDLVIVQCDVQEDSFIAAFDIGSGEQVWRTARDEIPSWSTPTVHQAPDGAQLITNATAYARGYDPRTGDELWRLGPQSDIVVPTPFVAHDLIYVASGYRPIKPIYAIRLNARGDLAREDGEDQSDEIAWSDEQAGPYMPTPIVYGDYFYSCNNRGVLTCYDARTGELLYEQRLRAPGATSFSASPIAADGKLYFTSEEGIVLVVEAGPDFKLLEANPAGESSLATPAISDGLFLLRTQHHLVAIGEESEG